MALKEYKAKRKFANTPEPAGGKNRSTGKALQFVVQKHSASHLHYDFRLELDGVLKSWAVPKGPSLDPSVRRLAMMVEDHPLDYMRFEGTIPEGNYGAGKVIVWDIGDYHAEEPGTRKEEEARLLASLAKGHLSIVLSGKKLKGQFSLVQMHGQDENAWLLIKKADAYASTEDPTKKIGSAISSRRLKDPEPATAKTRTSSAASSSAAKAPAKKTTPSNPRRPAQPAAAAAPRTTQRRRKTPALAEPPYPLAPMLATLVDKPFDGDDWVFETKWDGYRALGQRLGHTTRLYSRNGNSFATDYPDIFHALAEIEHDCLVDGEIVALSPDGRSSFQLLQNFRRTGEGKIRYMIFDLLYLDGHDLRGLPLLERKSLLAALLAAQKTRILGYSEHVAGAGLRAFRQAQRAGLEGVIAKLARGTYRDGTRSSDWLKVKTHKEQEALIAGFTAPGGARTGFGSLLLGVYEQRKLKYIGHVGTGFDEASLSELHARLLKLKTERCPFETVPKSRMAVTWVKPKLLCQVKFTEWTSAGKMRHPVFLGLREDKAAAQVRTEKEKPVEQLLKSKGAQNGTGSLDDDRLRGH